ncbi:probable polygalacturonase At3g15720 [Diospyros lotus]|uniref:probable polygalacturonase At3g15720 n=1 Tax=Diospyros lotus TaxID=55363 RepID=UPI002255910F|nr:probable polygalacturonase At3g15720 [Diospyros lotus]
MVLTSTRPLTSSSVMQYGAVGDGKTDDTQAFAKAWTAACGSKSDNTVVVPAGKNFLVRPLQFQGPCKSSSIKFQVMGKITAPSKNNFGAGKDNWLVFTNIDGLVVSGNGQIDGNGQAWWPGCGQGSSCQRPTALEFNSCKNFKLDGLTHNNSPKNHISVTNCQSSTISNLHIIAPQTSPNTDGIDISSSTNIFINHCDIGTGDDCIAINNGSSYINISRVNCGPGHGISIGSLGIDGSEGQVEEVHVSDCTFTRTKNGARIKTYKGGRGFIRKINYERITLVDTLNPILIDQHYCPNNVCQDALDVNIREISFVGFEGTSGQEAAIQLNCSAIVACTGIVLTGINMTPAGPASGKSLRATCINAHGTSSPSNVPAVSCLLP